MSALSRRLPALGLLTLAAAALLASLTPRSAWAAEQGSAASPIAPTVDPAMARLGKKLFSDARLSADWSVSCASCHAPELAYTDGRPRGVGVGGRAGRRNAPSLFNAAYSPSLFWDGRVSSLEEQALHPLLEPAEMGMLTEEAVVQRVEEFASYRRAFTAVYGTPAVTIERIVESIAAFERTLVSTGSPFDRYAAGDETALSAAARRGWELFRGEAGCVRCHRHDPSLPLFTDFDFHNTGVSFVGLPAAEVPEPAAARSPEFVGGDAADRRSFDLGRYFVSGRWEDVGAFKTPSLRNVSRTAPYMHDGSLQTLGEVLRFYAAGGWPNPYLDPALERLSLDARELEDLEAFLTTLADDADHEGDPRG